MSDKRYTIYGNSNDLDGIQEAIDLVEENERLNNIIDKALEYIKINGNWWTDEIEGCQDLIKILKGEEDGIE